MRIPTLQLKPIKRIITPFKKGMPVPIIFKKHILPLFVIVGALLSLNHERFPVPAFLVTAPSVANNHEPIYSEKDVTNGQSKTVHSATAVTLKNGDLLAMWYGGTREGHTDVKIYSARFKQSSQQWQKPIAVLDRYQVSDDLDRYIKKIGNPVLVQHPDGALVLIYVSVSMAGWATSQINMTVSYDEGQSWHASKRLVTSAFLNISTLVKNNAVIYDDGTIGITAYHELMGEFSEIVRVTLSGKVIDKYRISSGKQTIQPTLLIADSKQAIAYMRDSTKAEQKIMRAVSSNAGQTWSQYEPTQLDNPNSAVYAFNDLKGRHWMVFNDSTRDQAYSRDNLALAVSLDSGLTWSTVHYFVKAPKNAKVENKYSYPWLNISKSGQYDLFYTSNRKVIKHISFNQAWLEALL